MNRSSFATLLYSRYGECSCRSKARRREVRVRVRERAAPFTGEMRSISGTLANSGSATLHMNRDC